jgi:hypothetical protein
MTMTKEALSAVVDTCVTRSEMIDLFVAELLEDVVAKQKTVKQQIAALPFDFKKEFLALTPEAAACREINCYSNKYYSEGEKEKYTIRVLFEVAEKDLPKAYLSAEKERARLEEENQKLNKEYNRISSSKAETRLMIIRKALESTAEGQALLKNLSALKANVRMKLLPSKKED